MAKKSKRQSEALRSFDRNTLYEPHDALGIVRTMAFAKFDESVDPELLGGAVASVGGLVFD